MSIKLTLNKNHFRHYFECLEIKPEYDCSLDYFTLSHADICNSWRVANKTINGKFISESQRRSWDDFHFSGKHSDEINFLDRFIEVDSIEKMFNVWGCIDAEV